MEEKLKTLRDAGINVDEVMERFCGNEGLFLKILKKFNYDKSFSDLKNALASGDMENATAHVHTLKGVAGNLGMTALFDASLSLEMVLRGKEDGDRRELFTKLSDIYAKVADAVAAL